MESQQRKRYHFSIIYRSVHPPALSSLISMLEHYNHGNFNIVAARRLVDNLIRGYVVNHLNDVISFNIDPVVATGVVVGVEIPIGTILDVVRVFSNRHGNGDASLNQLITYIIENGGQGIRDESRYLAENERDFVEGLINDIASPDFNVDNMVGRLNEIAESNRGISRSARDTIIALCSRENGEAIYPGLIKAARSLSVIDQEMPPLEASPFSQGIANAFGTGDDGRENFFNWLSASNSRLYTSHNLAMYLINNSENLNILKTFLRDRDDVDRLLKALGLGTKGIWNQYGSNVWEILLRELRSSTIISNEDLQSILKTVQTVSRDQLGTSGTSRVSIGNQPGTSGTSRVSIGNQPGTSGANRVSIGNQPGTADTSHVSIVDRLRMNALNFAAVRGDLNLVKSLVQDRALLNASVVGMTPLHFAAENGRLEIVQYLVQNGYYLNIRDDLGRTPLHLAAENGYLWIVQYLVGNGYYLDVRDDLGRTPLHEAAENGYLEVVQYLVQNGYYLNIRDDLGRTPLHEAAESGYLRVVQYLVENLVQGGYDLSVQDSDNRTSLHEAVEGGYLEVVQYLVQRGHDLNVQDIRGRTPLHEAAEGGYLEVVQYLVQRGHDLNVQDIRGRTPLYEAYANGHSNVMRYLEGKGAQLIGINNDLNNLELRSDSNDECGSRRRKRHLGCVRESDDVFPYEPLREKEGKQVKNAKLHSQIALAVASKYSEQFGDIGKIVEYNRNMGDIINEGESNHSSREKALVDTHCRGTRQFFSKYPRANLLKEVEDNTPSQGNSEHQHWIFDDGSHSLLVLKNGNSFKLYGQDLNYRQILKTKKGVTFAQVKKFVKAFFWALGGKEYKIYTLIDPLPQGLVDYLKSSHMLQPENAVSDYVLLKEEHEKLIEEVSETVVRELFLLDGKVPNIEKLSPNFFDEYKGRLSFRVNLLHKALPLMEESVVKVLILVIRKYNFSVDKSYLKEISESERNLLEFYSGKVMEKVKSQETITPESLEELSYEALKNEMEVGNYKYREEDSRKEEKYKDTINSSKKERIIEVFKDFHSRIFSHLKASSAVLRGTATQGLFFLPDIIRAINTGDPEGLAKTGGMIVGDMVFNKGCEKLIGAVEKFEPKIAGLLSKLPITSPIFKGVVIYSIWDLNNKLKDPNLSPENRESVRHALDEQYATAAIMLIEMFGVETGPLWVALTVEQLLWGVHEFQKKYHIDASFGEVLWMSLGGEQGKLKGILTKRALAQMHLNCADRLSKSMSIPYGWIITSVPELVSNEVIVNSEQVPSDIKSNGTAALRLEDSLVDVSFPIIGGELVKNGIVRALYKTFKGENPITESLESRIGTWALNGGKIKKVIYESGTFKLVKVSSIIPTAESYKYLWINRTYVVQPSNTRVEFTHERESCHGDNVFLSVGDYSVKVSEKKNINPKYSSRGQSESEGCVSKRNNPAVITGGLAALYKNSTTVEEPCDESGRNPDCTITRNVNTVEAKRRINYIFDPREDNVALMFTREGIARLDEMNNDGNNKYIYNYTSDSTFPYVVDVVLVYKPSIDGMLFSVPPYGNDTHYAKLMSRNSNGIISSDAMPSGNFELRDYSNRVISRYTITDNSIGGWIEDKNTRQSSIMFSVLNSTCDVDSKAEYNGFNLVRLWQYDEDNQNKSLTNTILFEATGQKEALSINIGRCSIGGGLKLMRVDKLVIDNASSNGRVANVTLSTVKNFDISLLENIRVQDENYLATLGMERGSSTSLVKYSKREFSLIKEGKLFHYSLRVNDMEQVLGTIHKDNSGRVSFESEGRFTLESRKFLQNRKTLSILGSLKSGNETEVLKIDDNGTDILTIMDREGNVIRKSYLYDNSVVKQVKLDNLVLENITIRNSSNDTIVVNGNNNNSKTDYNFRYFPRGYTLAFTGLWRESIYHSFSTKDSFVINGINYAIKKGKFCAVAKPGEAIDGNNLIWKGSQLNAKKLGIYFQGEVDDMHEEVSNGNFSINNTTLVNLPDDTLIHFEEGGSFPISFFERLVKAKTQGNSTSGSGEYRDITTLQNDVTTLVTEFSTVLHHNVTKNHEVHRSNNSIGHKQNKQLQRASYLTNEDLTAIDQGLSKLDPVIVDAVKYLLITFADTSMHKCLGFTLIEDQENFNKRMKEKYPNAEVGTFEEVLKHSKAVETIVWLMVGCYRNLLMEKNVHYGGELSEKVSQCFKGIIDPMQTRRLIRSLEKKGRNYNITNKVEKFINNHQELRGNIVNKIFSTINTKVNLSHDDIRKLIDITIRDNDTDEKEITTKLINIITDINERTPSRNRRSTQLNEESVTSSAGRAESVINNLLGWIKNSVGGLLGFRFEKLVNSAVQTDISQYNKAAKSGGSSSFLSVENIALIGCIADALDNTQSKRYQNLTSKGVEFVPSINVAVRFALKKFDSFVESKIRNLNSKEQARIRTELKEAYPKMTASLTRGVEFSGNVGLDDVLKKCKKCFCTNILSKNADQSEPKANDGTDSKPGTSFKDVTISSCSQLQKC